MFKSVRNKKGMTLTEILVGGIMFAVFAIAISAIVSPMVLALMRASDFAEYSSLLDAVGNQISTDYVRASEPPTNGAATPAVIAGAVRGVDSVLIPIDGSEDVRYTIHAVDGTLLRNNTPVLPEGFYRGKQVSFTIISSTDPDPLIQALNLPQGSYIIRVNISVRANASRLALSGAELERDYYVRPILLINDTP